MPIVEHNLLKTPHGNTTIWRYMGLDKFLDLIAHRRLFFANAAELTDQYEATLPDRNVSMMRARLKNDLNRKNAQELADERVNELDRLRRLTFVNCWSMGRHESYARWKVYLGGAKSGIAIKSTVGRLRKSLANGPGRDCNVYLAEVQYADQLDTPFPNRLQVITTKKPYYDFEDELRAFTIDHPAADDGTEAALAVDPGRYVDIDLGSTPFSRTVELRY